MDHDTAEFWLNTLAIGAAVIWLVGAWFVARARRLGSEPLQDQVEVAKDPAAVTARLTRALADAQRGSVLQGSVVEAASEREVRWTSTGMLKHRGVATAKGDARRSQVAWEIHTGRGMQHVALAVVVVGGLVVGTLWYALREFALPSENPGVRGQVFQMVQAIHLLWPPFLFAGLSLKLRRCIGDEVRRVVQNAPFG
jgi:hypothetical protein